MYLVLCCLRICVHHAKAKVGHFTVTIDYDTSHGFATLNAQMISSSSIFIATIISRTILI